MTFKPMKEILTGVHEPTGAEKRRALIRRRNAMFLERVQAEKDRHDRRALMERIDPADMTIPTVDDLKGVSG